MLNSNIVDLWRVITEFLNPDMINACFELAGAAFILNHCRVLLADKRVAGVSTISVAFFVSWGFFNLFYYPSLDQTWSFIGAVVMVLCNLVWACLLVYYRRFPGGRS